MKVSTKSWHYRLIDFMDFRHPNNLCDYFWKTVWSVAVAIAVPIVALLTGLVVSFILLYAPVVTILWYLGIYDPNFVSDVFVISWTLVTIVSVVLFIAAAPALNLPSRTFPPIPKDSLVYQYIDAKHRKICPLLDFE